jgi:FkbM family methyltransferase
MPAGSGRLTLRPLIQIIKPTLSRTLYRPGSTATIMFGPSRGLRYRVFPEFGLAPIYGGWEPEAQRLMAQHIGRGGVVYDLGANRGIHAILFCRLVGPGGHVYAFEPLPEILTELEHNLALNGFSNATSVPLAVTDRSGYQQFDRAHHTGAGFVVQSQAGHAVGLEIQTTTLDDFVYERGNRPPTFIKVDIEGGEGAALAGARRLLEQARPTVLVDLHSPDQDLAVGNILADLGYRAARTTSPDQPIRNLRASWPDPDGLWGQILAIPEVAD